MATFLNRKQIVIEISNLLKNSIKEVIMIVPYIDISDPVFNELKSCEERGVEIIILYRKNKMNGDQRRKLLSLINVTLFNHPNVHAKAYLNEKHMIICSMNLYEYSELNNREMGVLLDRNDNDEDCYYDAVSEIQSIISSCKEIEHRSDKVSESGFDFKILRPLEDLWISRLNNINKIFEHKKFTLETENSNTPIIICYDFEDEIHVEFEFFFTDNESGVKDIGIHRVMISLGYPKSMLFNLYKQFKNISDKHIIKEFRTFWSNSKGRISLYRDKSNTWDNLELVDDIQLFKKGIEDLIDLLAEARSKIKK